MVGMLKGRKNDFLIQKSVELGVGELLFFPAERSISRRDYGEDEENNSSERVERIVVSACKQSGRATLMPVRLCASLAAALASLSEDCGTRYVFWEEESSESPTKESEASSQNFPSGHICALIGPEGGFSVDEIDQVRQAGFITRSLGTRILRAETAALTAAAILLHYAGELGPKF